MNKKLVLILMVLSILATLVSVAAAPQPVKTASLWGTYYSKNQVMVRFDVTGFSKKTDIRAGITVGGISHKLHCKLTDKSDMICSAPQMKRYAGQPAKIWVAGFIFYTQMPLN